MKITGHLIAVAITLLAFTGCGEKKEKKTEEPAITEQPAMEEKTTSETENASLTAGYWKLVELNGNAVAAEDMTNEANLVFMEEEGRFGGSNGCNRVGGFYTVDGESLQFSQLMNTQMACPPNDIEGPFMDVLETTESFSISGNTLSLGNNASATPIAVFVLDPTKE